MTKNKKPTTTADAFALRAAAMKKSWQNVREKARADGVKVEVFLEPEVREVLRELILRAPK